MGGEDAKTYGTLALLLAQYLQKDNSSQPSMSSTPAFGNLQPPAQRNIGGSVLGESGLTGGVSPAMIELLKQMQQRNTSGSSLNDEMNADIWGQLGVPNVGRSFY